MAQVDEFWKNIEKASQQLNDLLVVLDRAADGVNSITTEIETEIISLDETSQTISQNLGNLSQVLEEVAVNLETEEATTVQQIDTLQQLYTDSQDRVDSLADTVASSQETLASEVENNFGELEANIEEVRQGLTESIDIAAVAQEKVISKNEETQATLSDITQEFDEFQSQTAAVKSEVEFAYQEFFSALGEELVTRLENAMQKFDEQIDEDISKIVSILQSLLENLSEAVEEYSQQIEEIGSNFKEEATNIFQQLKEYIAFTLKEKIEETFNDVDLEIVSELSREVDEVLEMTYKGITLMRGDISPLMGELTTAMETVESMSKELDAFDVA